MIDHLVKQLKFARHEFKRVFNGVTAADAERRLRPNNALSWIVGHLAWQEQRYWVWGPTDQFVYPELNQLTAFGQPASIPDYEEMWRVWHTVTQKADSFLDTLDDQDLSRFYLIDDRPFFESIGTLLQRTTFHYWFHIGEVHALRQQMGHPDLPDFVGSMEMVSFDQDGGLGS